MDFFRADRDYHKEKLDTIQKLNTVYCIDESRSKYLVDTNGAFTHIYFQKGERGKYQSRDGVLDSDLLEIIRHRCEDKEVLKCIEEALKLMNKGGNKNDE